MLNHSPFSLRKATTRDIGVTFKWQAHPLVRCHSRNSSPPSASDHDEWFRHALKSEFREIWIFEGQGKSLGQLRVDKGDKNEVSILISPGFMGFGYGNIALQLLCNHYSGIDLWAYIKIENISSINLFIKNKFKHQQGNWYLLRSKKH
ncbi:MAG: GNAT family N-acetyltransferase [Colwellia sp.]|jgi:hypothetical protein